MGTRTTADDDHVVLVVVVVVVGEEMRRCQVSEEEAKDGETSSGVENVDGVH